MTFLPTSPTAGVPAPTPPPAFRAAALLDTGYLIALGILLALQTRLEVRLVRALAAALDHRVPFGVRHALIKALVPAELLAPLNLAERWALVARVPAGSKAPDLVLGTLTADGGFVALFIVEAKRGAQVNAGLAPPHVTVEMLGEDGCYDRRGRLCMSQTRYYTMCLQRWLEREQWTVRLGASGAPQVAFIFLSDDGSHAPSEGWFNVHFDDVIDAAVDQVLLGSWGADAVHPLLAEWCAPSGERLYYVQGRTAPFASMWTAALRAWKDDAAEVRRLGRSTFVSWATGSWEVMGDDVTGMETAAWEADLIAAGEQPGGHACRRAGCEAVKDVRLCGHLDVNGTQGRPKVALLAGAAAPGVTSC